MTKDEIEKMMLEAGLILDAYDSKSAAFWYPQIERFAHLVAKHTQEQCAKVCEKCADKDDDRGIERDVYMWNRTVNYCVSAIRAIAV